MTNNKLELLADDFLTQLLTDKLRDNNQVEIFIFFDNSDVRNMILGLRSFEHKIDRQKLASHQTLVQSLSYFGWIKNIRMLPPHQDELVDFLSKKHLLPIYANRKLDEDTINELLDSVGLLHIDKLKSYVDQNKIVPYLNDFKHKSIELFKLNYFLKDFNWLDRLKHLISFDKTGIINIDNSGFDYTRAMGSDLFKSLVSLFDEERKDLNKNNFRDAMALTLIRFKIDEYEELHSQSIPLFYATTEVIRKIREHGTLYQQFEVTVTIGDGKRKINVLRDSYYFVLDVLFNLLSEEADVPGELFERIDSFRNKYSDISFMDISSMSRLEEELDQLLFRDRFFYEFWFKKIEARHLGEYVRDAVSYDFLLSNRQVKQKMEKEVKVYEDKLSKNLVEFRMIELVWEAIDTFPALIPILFARRSGIDVFRDLAMARFSIEDKSRLQKIADTIFSSRSNRDANFYQMKVQLTNYIVNGVYRKDYGELIIGISVLFMFDKFREICTILSHLDYNYGRHFQLSLLHAASVYPAEHDDKTIVKKLLQPLFDKEEDHLSYKRWIGTGFVYYQIWKLKSNHKLIPEENDGTVNTLYDAYIDQAIEMANSAYRWLGVHRDSEADKVIARNEMYYYALNNLLYFKIRREEYSKARMARWRDLANELLQQKGQFNNLYWQSRFDHTLALYEYRRFILERRFRDHKPDHHLDAAKGYIETALSNMVVKKYDYQLLKRKIDEYLHGEHAEDDTDGTH